MNRIFIEGVDCSGKTTYVQDIKNYPTFPRLYPNDYKNEFMSWEVCWLTINREALFHNEDLLVDRSFLSIYVYGDISIELFYQFVSCNNLLKPDDEFRMIDIDFATYQSHAETKGKKDSFDCLNLEEFLRLKKKYWEILTSELFYRNFSFLYYRC